MVEYIKREDAINLLWLYADESCASVVSDFESLPAADVAPVRHGRWKNGGNGLYDTCTACGEEIYLAIPMNYCPLCGARMDKEDEHD